jgi:hypothetical protein
MSEIHRNRFRGSRQSRAFSLPRVRAVTGAGRGRWLPQLSKLEPRFTGQALLQLSNEDRPAALGVGQQHAHADSSLKRQIGRATSR